MDVERKGPVRTKDADNKYIPEVKTLIFPEERSTKGRLEEFDCLVLDYKKSMTT